MNDLRALFLTFFKMGAVTFGGGYAMLPILQREAVERKKWVTNDEVMDFYAVSQGMPGIIAVNVSVFIGYRKKRTAGAIAAALGVVSPCLLIITAIAAFLQNFQDILVVQYAFSGISICVTALILHAVIGLWRKGVRDRPGIAICAIVFALMTVTSVSPVLLVVAAAAVGILTQCILPKSRHEKGGRP